MNNINYSIDTADTTRVPGDNPVEFNINVTKILYPSIDIDWRPNAVILVPLTSYHFGLAASPIIHFPINAPLMFTHPDTLYQENLAEILRLSPTGKNVPAKVIIVGPVSNTVEMQLRNVGLSAYRIGGSDPIATAAEAMEFRYMIPSSSKEGMDNIMLVPADNPVGCIHAAYFSAHMGVPILFTYRDKLPELTKQKLRKHSDKNVFIISSERSISEQVANEIKGIVKGKVDKISGNTPFECAVNFSKYYSPVGKFGWNINNRDGWAFCFGNTTEWPKTLAACVFAHLGKHAPLLYVEPDNIPEIVRDYVLSLNPLEKHPPKPPFMHGYILGGYNSITHRNQVELEKILIAMAGE